jgi:hypothetical protein
VGEVNRGRRSSLAGVLGKRFSHDHLANSNDIVMSAYHEGIYFAKGGDGESGLLFIELQLLEGDNVARLSISGAKDDAIRALLYRVELFIRVHGARRREGRMVGPWRDEYTRGWPGMDLDLAAFWSRRYHISLAVPLEPFALSVVRSHWGSGVTRTSAEKKQ